MISTILGYVFTFFTVYLIPFIFAIGLIMFLYGCINYFVIGPGEEPKREEGREQLLWSFLLFLLGLAIYGIVMGFIWLGSAYSGLVTNSDLDGDGEAGINVREEVRLQRVPDVPTTNN